MKRRSGTRNDLQSDAQFDRARKSVVRNSDKSRGGEASEAEAQGRIFGVVPILEALRSGNRRIDRITIADSVRDERLHELLERARATGTTVHRVPRTALEREVGGVHQGVIAHVAAYEYADPDLLISRCEELIKDGSPPLLTVLDGLEDPRNLGAVLRTVECVGGNGVFVPERRAVGLTEVVAKTSAGAIEYVPVARVTNISRLLDQLKTIGVWTVGAAGEAKMDYFDWDWSSPAALVLGGEGSGLHRLVREHCDALVRIPMAGRIESLNVSVAAGVLLFEAMRQRRLKEIEKNNGEDPRL